MGYYFDKIGNFETIQKSIDTLNSPETKLNCVGWGGGPLYVFFTFYQLGLRKYPHRGEASSRHILSTRLKCG